MGNKTSVVMTTYNGTKYLKEQMDSLRDQSLPFDEVIIMDDCSTDGTQDMVRKYIDENKLSGWRLIENKTNQGWKRNFKLGFDLAQGDYIFPCDQDDVWHMDKCKTMIEVLNSHAEIDLLVSNYSVFFSEEDKGSWRYFQKGKAMKNSGSLEILGINPKWPYVNRPGCTYCFRKNFYSRIKDEWDDRYAHDAILWRCSIIEHSLGMLDLSLIDFRRHGDNATSIVKRNVESRVQDFDMYLHFHEIALNRVKTEEDKRVIIKGMKFLNERIKLYKTRNVLRWLCMGFVYKDYYISYRGYLGDLVFILRG